MPTSVAAVLALRLFLLRRRVLSTSLLACLAVSTGALRADPLSKKTDVDFFRDVPSRNLKRLAARSDGRLVAGPMLAELSVPAPADLLWCIEPTADATKYFVGTGPEVAARIRELAERVGVDEMAVVTWTHDEEVRRQSYAHLAKAFDLKG